MQTTTEGLTLEEVLREISRRHLIPLADGRLWVPNTHVPREIRRAIRVHRDELVQLIEGSDWRVCASPENHWRCWTDQQCEMCAHLQTLWDLDQAIKEKRRRRGPRVLASAG